MRTLLAALAFAAALSVFHAPPADAFQRVRNLLDNPGFEDGGGSFSNWTQVVPATVAISRPTFTVGSTDPKDGERCAGIRADYAGGFTSYTQSVKLTRRMRSLHLEGWARLDQVTFGGEAGLMLEFQVPEHEDGRVVVRSKTISGRADWTRFVIDTAIPEGAKEVLVRCGIVAPSVASFDALLLTASERPLRETKLFTVQSDILVRGPALTKGPRPTAVADAFVSVPMPISGAEQALFGIRINSRPEGRVRGFEIVRDGRSESVRVELGTVAAGTELKLRIEGLYLVTNRTPPDERKLIRLPARNKLPAETVPFVLPTETIDADDSLVIKARKGLKGSDFPAVVREVGTLTRRSLELSDGADVKASACLGSGLAQNEGFANVAAAILRARNVPARTMMVVVPGSSGEAQFLVESWAPKEGWTRLEPMLGQWPCDATDAVSFGDWSAEEHSPRLVVSHRANRKGNWRRCVPSEPIMVLEDEHADLMVAAASAYVVLGAAPVDGEQWFVENVSHPEIASWSASTRLVGQ